MKLFRLLIPVAALWFLFRPAPAYAQLPLQVIDPTIAKLCWSVDPNASSWEESLNKVGTTTTLTWTTVANSTTTDQTICRPFPLQTFATPPANLAEGQWSWSLRGKNVKGTGPIGSVAVQVKYLSLPGLPTIMLVYPVGLTGAALTADAPRPAAPPQ